MLESAMTRASSRPRHRDRLRSGHVCFGNIRRFATFALNSNAILSAATGVMSRAVIGSPSRTATRGNAGRFASSIASMSSTASAPATSAPVASAPAASAPTASAPTASAPAASAFTAIASVVANVFIVLATLSAVWPLAAAEPAVTIDFDEDIVPILTKAGCNSGGCHGKQSGRNGFKLSVFGFDRDADYQAIVYEGRGRRVFPAAPNSSLLLAKAANRMPHGGGLRLEEGSDEYQRLSRWIVAGMPRTDSRAPRLVSIDVQPRQQVMRPESRQALRVTGTFADGSTRDITRMAIYTANDKTLADVDRDGIVETTTLPGESAIVVRYQEKVVSAFVTVPMTDTTTTAGNPAARAGSAGSTSTGSVSAGSVSAGSVSAGSVSAGSVSATVGSALAAWDRSRFVDRLVAEKWERLHLTPSAAADDATFLRRATLDLVGRLPTLAETQQFLGEAPPRASLMSTGWEGPSDERRARLVDTLLASPEYADYWALRWADLLKVHREELGARSAHAYHQWLRGVLERNVPFDVWVRQLLTAEGGSETNGAVNFFRAFNNPNDLTVAVSQVFLGVRLECAKCHHHPYEHWGQDDFYGMAAFFARLQRKQAGGAEQRFFVADKGDVTHPLTKAVIAPRVLLGEPLAIAAGDDPRERLAEWLASPANPFFARAAANRLWAHLMGRGLVEPIDDMRETNPATNERLLAELAREFTERRFDLRHLLRTIATSRTYALSSTANGANARDTRNYSRAYRKRLPAEVLLDAVCDVTGEPEVFTGMPPGTRAVQLWDNRLPSVFLETFGRPQRKTVCSCERLGDSTLSQVLHLLNSPAIHDKLTSPTGRATRLAASDLPPERIVRELYLAALSRPPRADELEAALAAFASPEATRQTATEDVLWSVMNSAEFVLNH